MKTIPLIPLDINSLRTMPLKDLYEAKDKVKELIRLPSCGDMAREYNWNLLQIEHFIELRESSKLVVIKQSGSWWSKKDIDWFIHNADFAFRRKSGAKYKESRIWIKTKVGYYWDEKWEKLNFAYPAQYPDKTILNCFEFDVDNSGFTLKCETVFQQFINDEIIEKDTNAKRMLISLLKTENPKLVNPPLWHRLIHFKAKYIKIQ